MLRMFTHIGIGFAAGVLCFFILTAAVPAQVAPVPDEELHSKIEKSRIRLDEESQELANEYLDLLDDLSELIDDYNEYLNEIDEDNRCDNINFETFTEIYINFTLIIIAISNPPACIPVGIVYNPTQTKKTCVLKSFSVPQSCFSIEQKSKLPLYWGGGRYVC